MAAISMNHVRSQYLLYIYLSALFGNWPMDPEVIKRKKMRMGIMTGNTVTAAALLLEPRQKYMFFHILNVEITWKAPSLHFQLKQKPDVSGLYSLVL